MGFRGFGSFSFVFRPGFPPPWVYFRVCVFVEAFLSTEPPCWSEPGTCQEDSSLRHLAKGLASGVQVGYKLGTTAHLGHSLWLANNNNNKENQNPDRLERSPGRSGPPRIKQNYGVAATGKCDVAEPEGVWGSTSGGPKPNKSTGSRATITSAPQNGPQPNYGLKAGPKTVRQPEPGTLESLKGSPGHHYFGL